MATALDTIRRLQKAASQKGKEGTQVLDLRLDQLVPDPEQPRTTFDRPTEDDASGSIEGMAETMRAVGVIAPLTVVDLGDGTYKIQTGERRYRAALLAELETVPCRIVAASADTPLIQLIENLQRLALRPLETAKALERAKDQLQISQADLARKIGKSTAWVSKHLALLSVSAPTQEALTTGRITDVENARLFESLPSSDQRNLLVSQEPLTRARLEQAQAPAPSPAPEVRRPGRPKGKAPAPAPGLIYLSPLTVKQVERLFKRAGFSLPPAPLNNRNVTLALLNALGED
jgi:ParB/RepB/Spo0J family partition protein